MQSLKLYVGIGGVARLLTSRIIGESLPPAGGPVTQPGVAGAVPLGKLAWATSVVPGGADYEMGEYRIIVPDDAYVMETFLLGAGGGQGYQQEAFGGMGGYTEGRFSVTPGEQITLIVGGMGSPSGGLGVPGMGGIPGGGGKGGVLSATSGGGGGGGGYTGVCNAQGTYFLVAGGGGGGRGTAGNGGTLPYGLWAIGGSGGGAIAPNGTGNSYGTPTGGGTGHTSGDGSKWVADYKDDPNFSSAGSYLRGGDAHSSSFSFSSSPYYYYYYGGGGGGGGGYYGGGSSSSSYSYSSSSSFRDYYYGGGGGGGGGYVNPKLAVINDLSSEGTAEFPRNPTSISSLPAKNKVTGAGYIRPCATPEDFPKDRGCATVKFPYSLTTSLAPTSWGLRFDNSGYARTVFYRHPDL